MPPFVDPATVRCPKCETSNPVEIVYGLPSPEMEEAASTGAIALGGSIADPSAPIYSCRSCGHEFGELGEFGEL
jgi:hypothetical protein